MHELLKARVRPYYIYTADQVAGGEHFRTTVQKGLEIIQPLRGGTSGLAFRSLCTSSPTATTGARPRTSCRSRLLRRSSGRWRRRRAGRGGGRRPEGGLGKATITSS